MAVTIASAMSGPCFAAGLISKYRSRCTDTLQYYYAVSKNEKNSILGDRIICPLQTYDELFHVNFFYTAITCH